MEAWISSLSSGEILTALDSPGSACSTSGRTNMLRIFTGPTANSVNLATGHPDATAGRNRPLIEPGVDHHHPLNGVDQLMLVMAVGLDVPVFGVVSRVAADQPIPAIDLRQRSTHTHVNIAPFAIVVA